MFHVSPLISECFTKARDKVSAQYSEESACPDGHSIGARINTQDAWTCTKVHIAQIQAIS